MDAAMLEAIAAFFQLPDPSVELHVGKRLLRETYSGLSQSRKGSRTNGRDDTAPPDEGGSSSSSSSALLGERYRGFQRTVVHISCVLACC